MSASRKETKIKSFASNTNLQEANFTVQPRSTRLKPRLTALSADASVPTDVEHLQGRVHLQGVHQGLEKEAGVGWAAMWKKNTSQFRSQDIIEHSRCFTSPQAPQALICWGLPVEGSLRLSLTCSFLAQRLGALITDAVLINVQSPQRRLPLQRFCHGLAEIRTTSPAPDTKEPSWWPLGDRLRSESATEENGVSMEKCSCACLILMFELPVNYATHTYTY